MKKYFGLILLVILFTIPVRAFAKRTLLLRGYVPVQYSLKKNLSNPAAMKITSNEKVDTKKVALDVVLKGNVYFVTLVHR